MNTLEKTKKKIIDTTNLENKNGYVNNYRQNLLNGIEDKYFINDLMAGSGNELENKFKALWSSSALAVNNFVPFKKYIGKVTFFENIFEKAGFEEKYSTGLGGTPPNIDFFMENKNLVIGFESKYLEILKESESVFSNKYYSIKYLNNNFISLIKKYNNTKGYLHKAQLLKHSMGLINYKIKTGKNIILYYIYWTPSNWNNFIEYKKHEAELEIFSNELNLTGQIAFKCIKYSEFWNMYEKNKILNNYIKNIKIRYELEL